MSRPIIEVESVSKRYKLGQFNAQTMREEVEQFFQRFRKKGEAAGIPHAPTNSSEFWALKDISFSVEPGEVVGIIGRNAAGKSTLLKILSRITEPTSGEIRIRGRVASLLEVGTGFHPELTGRENIYLNGTILGMTKAEVKAKFDEIVAFAEIDKFLDTPVKRYSSGMYVRLAFAVAAHLEPEILIVDEVLAVGDLNFQKKCLGKMQDISANNGRTVLFVSHNLTAINAFCHRGVFLDHGRLTEHGAISDVINAYVSSNLHNKDQTLSVFDAPRSGGDQKAITEAWVENKSGQVVNEALIDEPIFICYRFNADRILKNPGYGFGVNDMLGQRIFSFANYVTRGEPFADAKEGVVVCCIPKTRLLPGQYIISLGLGERGGVSVDYIEQALKLQIISRDIFGTGKMFEAAHGYVCVDGEISLRDA